MRPVALLLAAICGSLLASAASAQQIPDRATLDQLLGPNQAFEDFESYSIGAGNAVDLSVSSLDDTTVAQGQGPGLVEPGATYLSVGSSPLFWNGDQYHGLGSRTIESGNQSIRIQYTPPAQAVGFDATNFETFGYPGKATFRDASDNVVGVMIFTLNGVANERVFVGWQHEGGIARVDILTTAFSWSPLIDDHGYGSMGPPGDPYCFGTGCPCANEDTAAGCANSSGGGATLTAAGLPSVASDSVVFDVAGTPASKPGLLLRGDNQVSTLAGDGLLCTSGNSQRSQVQVTDATGAATFADWNGAGFGSVANVGGLTSFQFWYRDPDNPCTGEGFNFSNGWALTYYP